MSDAPHRLALLACSLATVLTLSLGQREAFGHPPDTPPADAGCLPDADVAKITREPIEFVQQVRDREQKQVAS
jgi:hypothetical protein